MAGYIGINFSGKLQSNQALDGRHVAERSGYITVLEVALFVLGDGGREMLNGVLVASLAAGDTSVRRLDVAEGQVVVGLAENRFGFLQDRNRLLRISLLKKEPTLQHAHDSGHGFVA